MASPLGARTGSARPRGESTAGSLEVLQAPPLVTVQDDGRRLGRAMGVPRSGAMDLVALHATNLLVGNDPGAAALEWAGGGLRLRVRRPLLLATGGAVSEATLDDRPIVWGTPTRARPGSVLVVAPPEQGRWGYLAVAGGIAVPESLGSRSTYIPASLGGAGGRSLARGDLLPVGTHTGIAAGMVQAFELRERMAEVLGRQQLRVVRAPDADAFPDGAWEALLARPLQVLPASDRMGTRLSVPAGVAARMRPGEALASRPSEPACPGLVQVPPDGQPLVIMADGPTLGGYPAIACLLGDDLSALAQKAADQRVMLVER